MRAASRWLLEVCRWSVFHRVTSSGSDTRRRRGLPLRRGAGIDHGENRQGRDDGENKKAGLPHHDPGRCAVACRPTNRRRRSPEDSAPSIATSAPSTACPASSAVGDDPWRAPPSLSQKARTASDAEDPAAGDGAGPALSAAARPVIAGRVATGVRDADPVMKAPPGTGPIRGCGWVTGDR